MVDPAAAFTLEHLRHWWSAIAPACTAELDVSIDLWAILQRSWSLSPGLHQLPIVLGQTYEAELASSTTATPTRKRQGSYYTPEAIAQFMVEATLAPACRGSTAPTVLDPACGGGIFLVLAYRYLVQRCQPSLPQDYARLLGALSGVDIDPNAVAVTRLALGLAVAKAVLERGYAVNAAGRTCRSSIWSLVDPSAPTFEGTQANSDCSLSSEASTSNLESCSPSIGGRGAAANGEPSKSLWDVNDTGDRIYGLTSLSQTIRCGNALIHTSGPLEAIALDLAPYPLQQTQFDVVLGNPPYLDSEAMVAQLPHWRAYCRGRSARGRRYLTAQGNWDLFCVFIERALELCGEGGWHSFVVPNKLICADYAAEARSLLGQYGLYHLRDYSRVGSFQAAVYPFVYTLQKRAPSQTDTVLYEVMAPPAKPAKAHRLCPQRFRTSQPWCLSPPSQRSWLSQLQTYPTLSSAATVVGAASVSEAYRLQPLIYDLIHKLSQPTEFQVVNSGTIDRYTHGWGTKPLRYLGDRYRRPVIAKAELLSAFPKRYQQSASSKLIVAGLTQQLECVWDKSGMLMAGKSTTIILLDADQAPVIGPVLLGLLNSALMTAYFQAVFGGNALQGGYLRVGPPQVRSLPLPPEYVWVQSPSEVERLRELVCQRQLLSRPTGGHIAQGDSQQRIDFEIDKLVCQLYGVSSEDILLS